MTIAALRARALEHLGPYADARAREALERGEIVMQRAVARWFGSQGEVEAHCVGLGLDAALLGRLSEPNAVHDALVAALAAAISDVPGESLAEFRLFWNGEVRLEPRGYRDGSELVEPRAAIAAFLRARGQGDAASNVEGTSIRVSQGEGGVTVYARPPLETAAEQAAILLFRGFERREVRLRHA
jgi:hypothetical protein